LFFGTHQENLPMHNPNAQSFGISDLGIDQQLLGSTKLGPTLLIQLGDPAPELTILPVKDRDIEFPFHPGIKGAVMHIHNLPRRIELADEFAGRHDVRHNRRAICRCRIDGAANLCLCVRPMAHVGVHAENHQTRRSCEFKWQPAVPCRGERPPAPQNVCTCIAEDWEQRQKEPATQNNAF
jgi:hypothetical protein